MSAEDWIIVLMLVVIMILIMITASTLRRTKTDVALLKAAYQEVAENSSLLTTALFRILELHKPYGIYGPCGHDHHPDELRVEDIEWVGLVCDQGLNYWICESCCIDELQEQRAECVSGHHHDKDVDHRCPTVNLLAEVINSDSRHPVG